MKTLEKHTDVRRLAGANLKAARVKAGLKQLEIAYRCRLQPATGFLAEAGRSSLATQLTIAKVIGLTPERLFKKAG